MGDERASEVDPAVLDSKETGTWRDIDAAIRHVVERARQQEPPKT